MGGLKTIFVHTYKCDSPVIFCPVAQIGFDKPSYVVNEGNGSVEVCVRVRSGELGYPNNFRVSIGDGTAEGMP